MRKLLILFFLASCMQTLAQGPHHGLDISVQNESLQNIFSLVERQSVYRFIYTSEDLALAKKVSLSVKNAGIDSLLETVFKGQPVIYQLRGDIIVVSAGSKKSTLPAQPAINVNGKVTDEDGKPMAGVNISLNEKTTLSATDDNGNFSLQAIDPLTVLYFSSVGFEPLRLALHGRTSMVIKLTRSINTLDETVIKGYYSTTKRLNTGSVGKITADQIAIQPVSNPIAAIEGRVPGIFIKQGSGLPGSNFSVQIRGRNSIQSGTEPLYIIDGIPFISTRLTQQSQIDANSPFNTINPLDIESIEILKDADATSIYGSRGANGVILITTKKAKSGKPLLDIQYYTGFGRVHQKMRFMNTTQYVAMRKEAFKNDGNTPDVSSAPDLFLWDTTRYTDWQKTLIGGTAHSNNAQVRYATGNAYTKFTISANYYSESTVFPAHLGNKRGSISFNVEGNTPDNKISTSFSANYTADKSNLLSQDETQFVNTIPNAPSLYDSLGQLKWVENGYSRYTNPAAILAQEYNGTTSRLTGNGSISYKIIKGLQARVNLGYNRLFLDEYSNIPIASQDPSLAPTGVANFGTTNSSTWNVEPQVSYNTQIRKKTKLEILTGATWQQSSYKSTLINASGYTSDALIHSTTGASSIAASNQNTDYKYAALFARVNYTYNEQYILNATGRRDGSSRFGPGRQFANFGAIGAAWIFSKTNWIQKNLPLISFGKLRGSYGVTGNDQIGDYNYLDTWSGAAYPYQGIAGLFPTRLYNSNYGWEQIKKAEAALELGFFKDRLLITVDWFHNQSNNQLVNYSLPAQTGFTSIVRNFPGVVQNKGLELEISGVIISKKDFSWRSGLNVSVYKNKLISFPDLASSSYANNYEIGQPLGIIRGYRFQGVDPAKGVYQFEDKNKDGTLDQNDYYNLGSLNPEYYGGLQNSIVYKNFMLDFLLQFAKQKGYDPVFNGSPLPGINTNQTVLLLNRWQNPGDQTRYQQFTQSATDAYTQFSNLSSSGAVLTDASYIRLKTLSLSYALGQNFLKKYDIGNSKIFIRAQNLLTFTPYRGFDPETQSNYKLPPLQMVVVGFSLTF